MAVWVMGLSAAQRERLQQIASEVKDIVGGCLHADGRPMTFAELEEECIEAGDLLTAAVLQQRVVQRPPLSRLSGRRPRLDDNARIRSCHSMRRSSIFWMSSATAAFAN